VISYAHTFSGYYAILDDTAARKCARTFDIPTLGTVDVIFLAKRRGIIPLVQPALEALQNAGLWLGDDLINLILREAGE